MYGFFTTVHEPFDATVEFTAFAASYATCALSAQDQVYCWGEAQYGNLGQGMAG